MIGTITPGPGLTATAFAAAVLVVWLAGSASAEQSDRAGRSQQTHRSATQPKVPSTRAQSGVSNDRPWTLEDALPDKSPALQSSANAPKHDQLGSVPLKSNSGTLSVETESQFKREGLTESSHTPPGLQTSTRQPPQYLGLSLSVPTSEKPIIPGPLLPPFGRPE